MFKRFALIAVTAAVALVPATAQASRSAEPVKLDELCILKKIKPPEIKWIVDDKTPSTSPADQAGHDYDAENPYASGTEDDFTVHQDGQVEHDDFSHPC